MAQLKEFKKVPLTPHQRLSELLSYENKDIWVIIAYGLCSGFFGLVVPVAVQTLVNTIAFGSVLQPILVLTFLVLFILGVSALMRGLQVFLIEIVQQRIFARTSLRLSELIPQLSVEVLENRNAPELVNRFFDVVTIQKSTALIVLDGFSVLLQTVLGMVLLAFYHPILLAFDLVLVGLIFSVVFFLGKGAIETSIEESKKKYVVAGWLEELTRIPLLFKHPSSREFVSTHSDTLTTRYLKSRKAHFQILLRQVTGALSLQVIASSLLLGLGGWLVVKRQLTLGQLVAAELIVTSVVTGVGKFGKYLESYYDLVAAADKLGYLFELPLESGPQVLSSSGVSGKGRDLLRLIGVHYQYDSKNTCLKDIHLNIEKGEKVAIFGGRGTGKSTLCDILYRLKNPKEGLVEFQGIATKDLSVDQFRSEVVFLRSLDFFEGTFFDNLRIFNPKIQTDEIYEVLEKLGILKEIQALPEGLSTQISGAKSPLSTTQAKLLSLARAILSRPKLLILDAFLDDLDDDSRQAALTYLFKNPELTILFTTGSREIAKLAQNVWSLEKGSLRAESRMPK